MYPQPANDFTYIDNLEVNANIEIYNIAGKKLLSEVTTGSIDISNLGKGIYFLKIDDFKVLKFTK